MKNDDLVSVIIPSFGRPDGLERAIKSLLYQTYHSIEIIIVDDNNPHSFDRKMTEEVMNKFNNIKRIKYKKHPYNKNGSAARNTGIKHAQGAYITFLDNDDEYLPNKVSNQVSKLKSAPTDYGIVYSHFIRMINNKILDIGNENRNGDLTTNILKGEIFISAGSNIMVKRHIVEKVGGFNEKFVRRQDLEFLLNCLQHSKISVVPHYDLIIHKDDRSNSKALTIEEHEKNRDNFMRNFNKFIEELSNEEKEKVLIAQSFPILRKYLEEMRLISYIRYSKKINLKITTQIRYLIYLFKRKLFKRCYGFKL